MNTSIRHLVAICLCLALVSLAGPAGAQVLPGGQGGQGGQSRPGAAAPPAGPVVRTPLTVATLAAEHASVRPGTTLWLALTLKLKPGWHTYWRNPGDSGAPLVMEWSLPPGFKAGDIAFAAPGHHRVGPMVNYGYENTVVYLLPVHVPADAKAGGMVTLKALGRWLVCEKICVPEEGRFALPVFVAKGPPAKIAEMADTFRSARARLPVPSPWPASFTIDGKTARLTLKGAALKQGKIKQVWFYPIVQGAIDHAGPQKAIFQEKALVLTLPAVSKTRWLKSLDGVVVIAENIDSGSGARLVRRAFFVRARPGDGGAAGRGNDRRADGGPAGGAAGGTGGPGSIADGGSGSGFGAVSFWTALLFAFLGGLILNLMPCVLPVLSLKALGIAQHAHSAPGKLRLHGWAYTVGALATFGVITAGLIALRLAGQQVGWGYVLQSPLIVMLLAWLMVAIGLYFLGVFEFGGRMANVGSGLAARDGYSGSFFTGALAVVAASPCTVPFMGVAMGFAFTQPIPTTVVIMLALGFGMALPFLALSHMPGLLRYLPRPGPWMERFKQFLAFPMFATAVWLVWVVSRQAGDVGLLAALSGATLIAFAAWALQAANGARGGWRVAGVGAAVAAFFAAGTLAQYAASNSGAPTTDSVTATDRDGRRAAGRVPLFTPARLEALRASGRAVFVNYTADWCVTCIFNEKRILSGPWFKQAMARGNVVYMKGDWTRRDPAITRELARFNRLGVPLYVFYPAKGSSLKPEVLPQILTQNRVAAAIRKFGEDARRRAAAQN